MNYYPFHVGDYLADTRHLTWDEDCAYRRLLDVYYTGEQPLPLELSAIYRLVVASTDAQRSAVEIVLREFFSLVEEGWINPRADIEIKAMRERQRTARNKAHARWNKPKPVEVSSAEDAQQMPRSSTNDAPALPRHQWVLLRGDAPAMPQHDPPAMLQHDESDAAALNSDAVALLPTPTPTPIKEQKPIPTSSGGPGPPSNGRGPPSDPDPIFGEGLAFLVGKGCKPSTARSFLGLLRKQMSSDVAVFELLATAEREDVSDPLPWLRRAAETRRSTAEAVVAKPWDGAT